MIVVLIFQTPNLLNFYRFRGTPGRQTARIIQEETDKLNRQLAERQIDKAEYDRQIRLIRTKPAAAGLPSAEQTARTVNTFIPLGWLPYSAVSLLEGRILPSLLATLGLALIGTGSLVRCYGTTLRLYTGQFKGRKPHGTTVVRRQEVKATT